MNIRQFLLLPNSETESDLTEKYENSLVAKSAVDQRAQRVRGEGLAIQRRIDHISLCAIMKSIDLFDEALENFFLTSGDSVCDLAGDER